MNPFEVSILLIEAGIFIRMNHTGFAQREETVSILLIEAGIFIQSLGRPSSRHHIRFNPLNRGGDIHTFGCAVCGKGVQHVSILLIEAGIFILALLRLLFIAGAYVSILLIEAGIFIRPARLSSRKTARSFNPLNRGGDIHTNSWAHCPRNQIRVSILLIEAGIFIPSGTGFNAFVYGEFQSS